VGADNTLFIVHCTDTEGPLDESIESTFDRLFEIFGLRLEVSENTLKSLQEKEIDLNGLENSVSHFLDPKLLDYKRNWSEIDEMLTDIFSENFKNSFKDDFGGSWVHSWHCMDHIGILDNIRKKDVGYGKIFNNYKSRIERIKTSKDELNWHFHPLSLTRKSIDAATSFNNNYDVLNSIICRRIIDNGWFPVVNRPGFHSERPDSHAFLEQWIPFDYANQYTDEKQDQPDVTFGRFGDWSRSPKTWRGYNPSHEDYQRPGNCNRIIFRILNVGTRMRSLREDHVREAFAEANSDGSAILAFADHDWRDIRPNIKYVQELLKKVKVDFPNVSIKFSGAQEAALELLNWRNKPQLELNITLIGNRLVVKIIQGEIFGPQPFLAIKSNKGSYFHDNLDVVKPKEEWSYIFDSQTLRLEKIDTIGVGSAGKFGGYSVKTLKIHDFD
jgi:hypothetical protein